MLASVLSIVVGAKSDKLKICPYPQGRGQANGQDISMERKTNSKERDGFYDKKRKRHRCEKHQRVFVFPTTR